MSLDAPLSRPPSHVFRTIWRVVALIPRGRVATYGQVARMAGLLGGARTAGWALAALPDGLRVDGRSVPWHRVVNAKGRISTRHDHSGRDAATRQAICLRREGIAVSPVGGLDLARHQWEGRPIRAKQRRRRKPARTRR